MVSGLTSIRTTLMTLNVVSLWWCTKMSQCVKQVAEKLSVEWKRKKGKERAKKRKHSFPIRSPSPGHDWDRRRAATWGVQWRKTQNTPWPRVHHPWCVQVAPRGVFNNLIHQIKEEFRCITTISLEKLMLQLTTSSTNDVCKGRSCLFQESSSAGHYKWRMFSFCFLFFKTIMRLKLNSL